MLTKKDKLMITLFILIAIGGITFTSINLLSSNKKVDTPNAEVSHETEKTEPGVALNHDKVTFKEDGLKEFPEEEAANMLPQVDALIKKGNFKEIVNKLSPIIDEYNLDIEKDNIRLGQIYSDANRMVVQEDIEDMKERGNFVVNMNDTLVASVAPLYLPMDAFLYSTYDVNSLNVGSRGDVIIGDEERIPTVIKDEKNVDMINPILKSDAHIALFWHDWGEINDIESFSIIDMTIRGVEVSAYIANKVTGTSLVIGYYDESEGEPAFKTNQFYFEQAQSLNNAIQSDWE